MFRVDTSDLDAGVAQLEQKLDRVAKVSSDMTPLWGKIGEIFAAHQRDVFSSGYDWQPLEAATIVKKGSAQVLVETGRLMQAATSATPVEANRLYAKFGLTHSQVPYAHWHARGAGVPERDPVPDLTPTVRRQWLEIIAERVREELAR
jgi:hypothetical protein